jgi:uncharacterized protein
MPANLTPDYLAAERRFKAAQDPKERIEALEEMLSVIPKHKGTEHLRGDLKRKLSQLREEARTAPRKGAVRRVDPGYIPKQGAGQAVLLGASNVGKSALLRALTNAEPEVAPYPYTTRKPLPGMMMFEDTPIQLVDALAVERTVYEPWMNTLVHNADLAFVVLDPAAPDVLGAVEEIQDIVIRGRVKFVPAWWAVGKGKASRAAAPVDDVPGQELADDELLARLDPGDADLPVILLVNKLDVGDNRTEVTVLSELLGESWPLLGVSAETGEGLEAVREVGFRALRVIRVYAKPPGKPASTKAPIILPVGATVRDMARLIHKELETNLRFARIWSARHFDGQRIPRDAELHDQDVVELNA